MTINNKIIYVLSNCKISQYDTKDTFISEWSIEFGPYKIIAEKKNIYIE